MNRVRIAAILTLVMAWTTTGMGQTTPELLGQAIYAEETEGNLIKAMRLYDQVISQGTGEDIYVARALYRKSMCQLKAGQGEAAQRTLEKLLGDFSDQEQIIHRAREAMAGLHIRDPAELMPPETLAYLEFGSPGHQIDRLLSMLAGTPLANPLAALGGGGGNRSGQAGPAVILQQLLNPSMLDEFKKIQGLAIGATQISQENSPVLAVLYPGESDALKGILRGLIGSVMRPAGNLSGLSLFQADDKVMVAYDDHVILGSTSMELLQFAIQQYQQSRPGPSLADSHSFFMEMPKQMRQSQLLTLWVDGDQAYRGVMDLVGDDVPMQLVGLNALAGISDVDELFAVARLDPDSMNIDVEVRLSDGHHCLVYDLIRTPSWSGADLAFIPDNAAALLSLGVGDAGWLATQAIQKPIRRISGLDVGRELFANIEQLTLFVVPPQEARHPFLPPFAQSIGLGIRSAQPELTRSLLHRSLTTLNHILSKGHEEMVASMPDQDLVAYKIAQVNDQPFSLYVGRRGPVTVLSLDPNLAQARDSNTSSSTLGKAIQALPPSTSKAVMVNLGGLVQLQQALMPHAFPANGAPGNDLIAELSHLLAGTHLVLHTEEEENRLAIRLSLSPIPRLEDVLSQVAQVQVQVRQTGSAPHDHRPQVQLNGERSAAELRWIPRPGSRTALLMMGMADQDLTPVREVSGETTQVTVPDLQPDTTYRWQLIDRLDGGASIPSPEWTFSTAGLMAHYTFSSRDGEHIHDGSHHARHGLAFDGAAIRDAYEGRSGVLDCRAPEAHVKIPRPIAGDFTLALWVHTTHPGNTGEQWWEGTGLVDGEVAGPQNDFGTSVVGGRFAIGVGTKKGPNQSDSTVRSTRRVDDGVWHHLVAVRDATSGIQTLYVDGVVDGSVTGDPGMKQAPSQLRLGSLQSDAGHGFFQGCLDDVRLYSYALNADEIAQLLEDTQETDD